MSIEEHKRCCTCTTEMLSLAIPHKFDGESISFRKSIIHHVDEIQRWGDMKADIVAYFALVYYEGGRWQAAIHSSCRDK
jgi:hypothetical protein